MMLYNRKRSAEWIEAQKKIEADSLDAARIAYMTGKATEEQIELVEEQLERERKSGEKKSFFSDLSVLGAPTPAGAAASTSTPSSSSSPSPPQSTPSPPQGVTETISWPTADQQPSPDSKKSASLWSWLTSNLKREEQGSAGDDAAPSPNRRLGLESLSEEDDGACVPDSAIMRAVEEKRARKLAEAEAKGEAGAESKEVVKKKGWLW